MAPGQRAVKPCGACGPVDAGMGSDENPDGGPQPVGVAVTSDGLAVS